MNPEDELKNLLGEDELEIQVRQKISSFHGFLTREVALKLIAKEKGLLRDQEKSYQLRKIPKNEKRVSFAARVTRIWPKASYGSGKTSRVIELEDESGTAPLVLWNEDTSLANNLRLKDLIHVKGAYEKNGELHFGYGGKLEVAEREPFTKLEEIGEGQMVHVRGNITKIEGYDAFVHGMNTSKAFSFLMSDGTEKRVVIWELQERGENLKQGDEIIIEGGLVNKGNIELSSDARILSRRNMLIGELKKIECAENRLMVVIDEKELEMDRRNALRFVGVEVADDIGLCTVVSLKKDSLLNKRIAVKIDNGRVLDACIKLESC
ncbi:hypothetical protein JXA56_05485 [Candidatus Micrarchaeota archaeon]|nr:hypothetical protein [Candidatus Micrarchaeota archaeon]